MATLGATASTTTFPATAADVGAEASGAVATHAGAGDPHTGYQLESGLAAAITATKIDDLTAGDDNTDLNASTTKHGLLPKLNNVATDFLNGQGAWAAPAGGGGGAPTTVDYLVGTASGDLSAEIVAGTAPGGELGGTWASPTVDATHSGSSHAGLSGQPGSTDVAVADGGTGASTAAAARTNLDVLASTAQRFGRTVNAGTANYQQPGRALTAVTTFAPTVNQLSYWPMWTPTQITLDLAAFNVTIAPASDSLVRIGVYAADASLQPSGNPLADLEVAVAAAFTGIKTGAISAVVGPGSFLLCLNLSVVMTMRAYTGNTFGGHIDNLMGAGTLINFMAISSAYGAMPAPGTAWTFDTGGAINCPIAFRVGTP